MSKLDLRVRFNNKLHSIILNDYRIGGCKWNDIEYGKCIEYPVNKEDIVIALGIDKTIADLQSQLDQLKQQLAEKEKEIERFMSMKNKEQLVNENEALKDTIAIVLAQKRNIVKHKKQLAIQELAELKENAIVPKFKIGQEVWHVYNKYQKYPFRCVIDKIVYDSSKNHKFRYDTSGELYVGIKEEDLFATEEEAQAKLKEIQRDE